MKNVLVVVAALSASGCMSYTPPIESPAQRVITVQKPYETVWDLAIDWFGSTGVGLDKIQKESGLISAAPNSVRPGKYLNCGKIGMGGALEEFSSSMNVVVRKVSEDQTKVTVNVVADGMAIARNAYGAVLKQRKATCLTTGELEKSFHQYVSEAQ